MRAVQEKGETGKSLGGKNGGEGIKLKRDFCNKSTPWVTKAQEARLKGRRR